MDLTVWPLILILFVAGMSYARILYSDVPPFQRTCSLCYKQKDRAMELAVQCCGVPVQMSERLRVRIGTHTHTHTHTQRRAVQRYIKHW